LLTFFFIQHFQRVITQNSVQWSSLPQGFLRAWWRLSCYVLHIDERGKKCNPHSIIVFSSPFTGYLPLSHHFIFIITLFISIITFLTKVCHHHHPLSRTSASYYHFPAISLVSSPPFYFHYYIIILPTTTKL
jgi:hypothetical protein